MLSGYYDNGGRKEIAELDGNLKNYFLKTFYFNFNGGKKVVCVILLSGYYDNGGRKEMAELDGNLKNYFFKTFYFNFNGGRKVVG